MLDMNCGGGWEEFHIGSIEGWNEAGRQDQSQAHHPSFKAGKNGQKLVTWLSCILGDGAVFGRRFRIFYPCPFRETLRLQSVKAHTVNKKKT